MDVVEAIRTIGWHIHAPACAFPAFQDNGATPTQAGKQNQTSSGWKMMWRLPRCGKATGEALTMARDLAPTLPDARVKTNGPPLSGLSPVQPSTHPTTTRLC
ncbi:hypothetical protein J3459_010605 [Metarhizium acridum]|nr:hypothetical protein J3459_010605 [Metarhizium acridum]